MKNTKVVFKVDYQWKLHIVAGLIAKISSLRQKGEIFEEPDDTARQARRSICGHDPILLSPAGPLLNDLKILLGHTGEIITGDDIDDLLKRASAYVDAMNLVYEAANEELSSRPLISNNHYRHLSRGLSTRAPFDRFDRRLSRV